MILQEFGERSWPTVEKHWKIGRDSIVGRAVGGRDVGEIKRTPAWNARREQPGFIGLRRDRLIRDGSAYDNGECSRNLIVAVRDGPRERIGFTACATGLPSTIAAAAPTSRVSTRGKQSCPIGAASHPSL